MAPETKTHFTVWLCALGAYILSLPFWLPLVTDAAESATLLTRAAISIGAILPAGVLMGFGFPTGMRLVTRQDPRPTPWFWGTNGAAGVFAAGLGVATSIAFSIDTTTRLAGLCYLFLSATAFLLLVSNGKSAKDPLGAIRGRDSERSTAESAL
jgi:hypothetical protein